MAGLNVRDRYQLDPFDDDGEAGGLPGLLLRAMRQQTQPHDAGLGATPNAAPETYSASYGTPQGGLLGSLLALQAQQNQLFAGGDGQTPSAPTNADIRTLTRVYVTTPQRGEDDPTGRSDDQSNSAYFGFGDNNSPDLQPMARQGGLAAPPHRSLSDKFKASWDHPSPYGVISKLKEILNAIPQAVQGSIDATSVPSTEEEAFRQNLGREQGPIGAWQAVSGLRSMTPRGVGGILGRPLITSRELWPQLGDKIATPRSVVPLNSAPAVSKPGGGLFGPYSDKSALPWIAAAPGIQAGLDVIEAGRKRYREPLPRGVSLLNYKPAPKKPYGSQGGLGRGGPPRKGIEGDPDDLCNDLHIKEQNRCIERLDNEEYADVKSF